VKKYVLDTNVYIRAFRNPLTQGADLERFQDAWMPVTYLSSVVYHELRVGANTPAMARDLSRRLASTFIRRNRIVVPTHETWIRAAEVISKIAKYDGLDRTSVPKGFTHDVLIAISCRENGCTLVTENARDFRRIQMRMKFEFVEPWPS
jgi:predicted nucleic acid-binding protein